MKRRQNRASRGSMSFERKGYPETQKPTWTKPSSEQTNRFLQLSSWTFSSLSRLPNSTPTSKTERPSLGNRRGEYQCMAIFHEKYINADTGGKLRSGPPSPAATERRRLERDEAPRNCMNRIVSTWSYFTGLCL